MIRAILIHAGLLMLPFGLWSLLLMARGIDPRTRSAWTGQPVLSLLAVGVVLMAISLILLADFGGAPPGASYVPAQMKDGVLVPGHYQ